MPHLNTYRSPEELVLGVRHNERVPLADQLRQRGEVEEILQRLTMQPGVVLADEVGTGKTFVALGVGYSVAVQNRRGPVIVMAPANLIDKWVQDLKTFCELYLADRQVVSRDDASPQQFRDACVIRYGIARHSVELMKLLDDKPSKRCHLVFLAQGSMSRQQTDKWIRLALIREALRRHGRGRAEQLIKVKSQIHRFLAELLWAIGEQRASEGEDLWQDLLRSDPGEWKEIYNRSVRAERHFLTDDPVPEAVIKALPRIDVQQLADALRKMPLRARGGDERVTERITAVRSVLKTVVRDLWKHVLAVARWRSPLLIMDEAHHLKNPATSLARQLQSPDSDADLRTGDGALARAFDRMLFLTATPFQLGHLELVQVMNRFGDVRWDPQSLGDNRCFEKRMANLAASLNDSQRSAIALQRCWSQLPPDEAPGEEGSDCWWQILRATPTDQLTPRQRALIDGFRQACACRAEAEAQLRPWLIRHNKAELWPGTAVSRRRRWEGAAIAENGDTAKGLKVPPEQLLPFFLAARSAVSPGKDLLGDALCSSYEAFRFTRETRMAELDEEEDGRDASHLAHAAWYLEEFDQALTKSSGSIHPKVAATVRRVVDLWEAGEKVLVFAFYRRTCRAVRIHISQEIERRLDSIAQRRFADAGRPMQESEVEQALTSVQNRYFDDLDAPGRKALDEALQAILERRREYAESAAWLAERHEQILDVMRRFLRVRTTLVRSFPIHQFDTLEPHLAVCGMLDNRDASGVSWRDKFERFVDFLLDRCSSAEREQYLEAAAVVNTGKIRVEAGDPFFDDDEANDPRMALANVQEATGKTSRDRRSRLMRAFNTPFFPDILVCSQVMGEGVDLQWYCSHVIHHDLAWNPSSIEQRTGRVDRLGCKAEGKQPIHVYLPYLAGAADERQFRVMADREQWFRIVMGQDQVAKLIPCDDDIHRPQLPAHFTEDLTFHLGLGKSAQEPASPTREQGYVATRGERGDGEPGTR